MGIFDKADSGIMIDSRDATQDKNDLKAGCASLEEVKKDLAMAREMLAANWKGSAAMECDQLLEGFIRQVDEAINAAHTAATMLNTIVVTYQDADRALSGKM